MNNINRKLIIQIPCLNEEASLPYTLSQLPRKVDGFSIVEWLIIDDGSTDNTVKIAKENNVDHIVSLEKHLGLAKAFALGLDACLKLGADVIVNTDADNQYCAEDIVKLTTPINNGDADMVVGERPISNIDDFSSRKKALQKIGSWVVRVSSGTNIPDATSGFRAISKEAAYRLNIFDSHTYTLETIIQSSIKNIRLLSVPIKTNPKMRESKLIKSTGTYILKSSLLIFKLFFTYQPFKFFMILSGLLFIISLSLGIRFSIHYFQGVGNDYLKSLVVSLFSLMIGAQSFILAFLSDMIATNRRINEEILYKIRKMENKNEQKLD